MVVNILKKTNKILSIIIKILLILFVIYCIFSIIDPLLYGKNSKGKRITDNSIYPIIETVIQKHITDITSQDYKETDKVLPMVRKVSKKRFESISSKFKSQYEDIIITNIEKKYSNIYVVSYKLKTVGNKDISDKIVIKTFDNKTKATIYYDGLLKGEYYE